ncbi:MAG TPA: hypothetical protein VJL34_04050 [Anaerolineales bacterium]|nr:hypothetical protein [Anaerolineales bacterium]
MSKAIFNRFAFFGSRLSDLAFYHRMSMANFLAFAYLKAYRANVKNTIAIHTHASQGYPSVLTPSPLSQKKYHSQAHLLGRYFNPLDKYCTTATKK